VKLPAPRYWFTGKALPDACFAVFGAFLAIISLTNVFEDWFLSVLGFIGATILAFQWYAAARQNVKDEAREADMSELLKTVKLLANVGGQDVLATESGDALAIEGNSRSVENIAALPVAKIRDRVRAVADGMRTFEAGKRTADMRALLERQHSEGQTEEQKNAAWRAETNQMMQRSIEAQNEFRSRYMPEASALRDEMSRRLGIFPPYSPDHRTVALDYGMLAGVSPLSDAADYLEALARRLPN
jgi:hypothetical protein